MKKLILLIISIFTLQVFSQSVVLESFGPNFDSPVEIKNAGDDRLFVVEQTGKNTNFKF